MGNKRKALGKGKGRPVKPSGPIPADELERQQQAGDPGKLLDDAKQVPADVRMLTRAIRDQWLPIPEGINEFAVKQNGKFLVDAGRRGDHRAFNRALIAHLDIIRTNQRTIDHEIQVQVDGLDDSTDDNEPILLPKGGPWDAIKSTPDKEPPK